VNTNASVWLITLPLAAGPLIYFIGHLGVDRTRPNPRSTAVRWAAFLVLLSTWLPYVQTVHHVISDGPLAFRFGTIGLQVDGLSLLLAGVALALGTLVALYSGPYIAGEVGEAKYYAMLVLLVGMMIGLGCTHDLFNLWVWFEGMAISSYLLVAFYRERPASLEAGVKYLVQSATGSVLILLGIALVFAQTGQLDLDSIRAISSTGPVLAAAGALFTIGFGVKIALVPLHTWLPDAHAQAPSGISAMLSGVVIESGLVALLRTLTALAGGTDAWGVLLMGFGALNMLVGNLMALRQKQVKRLLAYSSLTHIGYMLTGLGIAFYVGESAGAQGGLFHLINHGLMKGLAFLAAGALLYAISIARRPGTDAHDPLTTTDLDGTARRYPLVALAFSLAVLGLGGLPPLAGFMSKWQIFVAGFATHNVIIDALVIFVALNSVLSLAYYVPLVNAMYRQKPSLAVQEGGSLSVATRLPLVLLALAVVAVGIWPNLVQWLVEPASKALLVTFGG
jgi:proton-translocating NADH-quinone oxidoreductase chain N